MGVSNFSQNPNISSDAAFQAVGAQISALFTLAGWLQTSDTGQVDWATVVRPPVNTGTVYEVWKTNDGLTQVFMRINYKLVTGGTALYLGVTLGTGSDGAGNITGTFIAGEINTATASYGPTSTPYDCRFCYAGNSFVLLLWRDSTNPLLICVERSRDSSGAPDSRYVSIFAVNQNGLGGGTHQYQSLVFGVGKTLVSTEWPISIPNTTANTLGTNTGISDVCPCVPSEDNSSLLLMNGRGGDFAEAVTTTFTWYGASHTYMATKTGNNSRGPAGDANGCLLFLYE